MHHLNDKIYEGIAGPIWRLAELFLPEQYEAVSIGDFLRHRDEIQVTKKIIPAGVMFYGCAIVHFRNAVVLSRDRTKSTGPYYLSDLSHSIEVSSLCDPITQEIRWFRTTSRLALALEREKSLRLYEVSVSYTPKTREVRLIDWKSDHPHVPKRATQKDTIPDIARATCAKG